MKIAELIKEQPKRVVKGKKKGYVLFEGKSNLNGGNIVGIITLNSNNIKTGAMYQLWIMNADISPIEALHSKKDDSVCGDCKLRQSMGGACYVNLGQAPLSIWKAYKRGSYSKLETSGYDILSNSYIRFGAYGDPSALPIDILVSLKAVSINNTSYTHQWKKFNELKSFSMASVDSEAEAIEAVKLGFRYFRTVGLNDELLKNEIICPNITSGINCIDCGLCNGNKIKAKNIVIPVHGSWAKRYKTN